MRHLSLVTLAAAAAVAAAAPAFAQSVDELVIVGQPRDAEAQSLSRAVSYSDLDLTYAADRAELRHRINVTARELCDQLNEPTVSPLELGHSCQDIAVRNASYEMRVAVEDAYAQRGYAMNDYGPR